MSSFTIRRPRARAADRVRSCDFVREVGTQPHRKARLGARSLDHLELKAEFLKELCKPSSLARWLSENEDLLVISNLLEVALTDEAESAAPISDSSLVDPLCALITNRRAPVMLRVAAVRAMLRVLQSLLELQGKSLDDALDDERAGSAITAVQMACDACEPSSLREEAARTIGHLCSVDQYVSLLSEKGTLDTVFQMLLGIDLETTDSHSENDQRLLLVLLNVLISISDVLVCAALLRLSSVECRARQALSFLLCADVR